MQQQDDPTQAEASIVGASGSLRINVQNDRLQRELARAKRNQELRDQTARLSREPFRDQLADFLANNPTPEAIQQFANRNPDRWAQAVAILARSAGYADTNIEIKAEKNIYLQLQGKSDAELLVYLENAFGEMGMQVPDELRNHLDPRRIIDITPEKDRPHEGAQVAEEQPAFGNVVSSEPLNSVLD